MKTLSLAIWTPARSAAPTPRAAITRARLEAGKRARRWNAVFSF
ncbi:MAG: hypothetical protein ACE5G2_07765 [Candidatus Krumholzibacteriia bacterium]